MKFTLGFIGFGEASYYIAKGLVQDGVKNIAVYDKFWDKEPAASLISKRVAESGVTLVTDLAEMVSNSGIVICSTSATLTVPIAKEIAPMLQSGQIYADLNSSGPEAKQEAASFVDAVASFVDIAIMDSVPAHGHKVTMLLSGKGAQGFYDVLHGFNTRLTVLDGPCGKAAATKMCRSIFMKGINSLLFETVAAAEKYEILDDVLASIYQSFEARPVPVIFNGLLCGGAIHASRRGHEMEEVVATLKAAHLDYVMSEASAKKLEWVDSLGFNEEFGGVVPKEFSVLLPKLLNKK